MSWVTGMPEAIPASPCPWKEMRRPLRTTPTAGRRQVPTADRSKPLIQVPGHGPFGRHARKICHGKKGELVDGYERGLENELGVVGLVVNCVVL